MHIKQVYRLHQDEINALPTEAQRIDRLVELNVIEQVQALSHTSIIQQAWSQQQKPMLHGWVYGLGDGLLKPLVTLESGCDIGPIFQYENAANV
jgi:carbonic anhydrase